MPFVAPPNNYVECYCRYNFLWKTTDTNPNNLSLICLPWICVSPLNLVSSFLYFWCPSKSSDVCSEWLLNVDCSAHFLLKTRAPDKSCSSSTTSHPESINNFFQKTSFRPDIETLWIPDLVYLEIEPSVFCKPRKDFYLFSIRCHLELLLRPIQISH